MNEATARENHDPLLRDKDGIYASENKMHLREEEWLQKKRGKKTGGGRKRERLE